jgi:hypothetical protein
MPSPEIRDDALELGGQHVRYTQDVWRAAIAGRETLLGYWDWVQDKRPYDEDNEGAN